MDDGYLLNQWSGQCKPCQTLRWSVTQIYMINNRNNIMNNKNVCGLITKNA